MTTTFTAETIMSKYGRSAQEALRTNKLAPKKRLGQNFLVHKQTAEAIVRAAGVEKSDIVVEVGVGLGALTLPLAAMAKHVYGYEIDSGIIRLHEREHDLPENVTLVHQDILKADFEEMTRRCGGPLTILANLPYSISNPFIFKLIDNASKMRIAIIMLQKEVAERLMASPNTKEYGVPTVLLGNCATVRKIMTLNPGEFHPRPKIDSVVIAIDFAGKAPSPSNELIYDYKVLRNIVRATFNQRRKTIHNTLTGAGLFAVSKQQDRSLCRQLAGLVIERAGLQPNARPETLSVNDFIRLAREVEKINNKNAV